mmetsp:Transcript_48769/g.128855  ORF Transcript_48769/g.128855 Transcript_48769/m.128855 type:complete len:157 (+) Transcript_48769:1-471(+)
MPTSDRGGGEGEGVLFMHTKGVKAFMRTMEGEEWRTGSASRKEEPKIQTGSISAVYCKGGYMHRDARLSCFSRPGSLASSDASGDNFRGSSSDKTDLMSSHSLTSVDSASSMQHTSTQKSTSSIRIHKDPKDVGEKIQKQQLDELKTQFNGMLTLL